MKISEQQNSDLVEIIGQSKDEQILEACSTYLATMGNHDAAFKFKNAIQINSLARKSGTPVKKLLTMDSNILMTMEKQYLNQKN